MPSPILAFSSPVHSLAFLALLTTATNMAQASPSDLALHLQQKRGLTYAGCYSSSQPMTLANTYTWQTSSWCETHFCSVSNSAVLGLSEGGQCWCGSELPPASSLVDDSSCSTVCNGFGSDKCGGDGFWSVYYTGSTNIANFNGQDSDSSSSSSSSSATSSTSTSSPTSTSASTSTSTSSSESSSSESATLSVSTSVAADHTVLITIMPSASNNSKSHSNSTGSGSDTVGIAVGVVVGLVGFAAIIAGVFLFLRHRRRQQVEEEYKRTQITEFFRPTHERKAPGSSYSHASDSRLEPAAGTHRNSVGSLADDQDYSRRILRVANPDDM